MSLITERTSPLVADDDIKVYKIVRNVGEYYYSPFIEGPLMQEPWDTETEFNKKRICSVPTSKDYKKYIISGGGIHAYLKKEEAEKVANMFDGRGGEHYMVIEGKIPAGTEYYDSHDGEYVCSRKIFFDEKYLKRATGFNKDNYTLNPAKFRVEPKKEGLPIKKGEY